MASKKKKNKRADQFKNLDVQECQLIYPALLANADRHYNIAQELSDMHEFGAANSHLTIAAEELILAMTIYFEGWGMPISWMKKLTRFFDSHEDGFTVSPLVIMMGAYIKSLFTIFESFTKGIMTFKFLSFKKIFEQQLNPLKLVKESHRYSNWWADAKLKQSKGFYVEYNMELITPDRIKQAEYEASFQLVTELRESCLSTIEFTKMIPEKRRQQFFKWIKNYFEPFMKRLSKLPLSYFRTTK